MQSDWELKARILEELRLDPGLRADEIGVAVKDGVVTLGGCVDSYVGKWAARCAAERVAGAKGVAVEIEVRLPGDSERADADFAQDAENALVWDVRVPVKNAWITLNREVDRYSITAS